MNYYVNWLLYAVVGRMQEADGLLEKYQSEIYEFAGVLNRLYPVALEPLWRGVLVEPTEVVNGKLAPDPRLSFVSFSRDYGVAEWFADTKSIMSGYVKQIRPSVEGYIASVVPKVDDVLFDAEWARRGMLSTFLSEAANMHPHIDGEQFCWNVRTQSEVIVKPQDALKVVRYSSKNTKALDEKYCMPQFRSL